MRVNAASSNFYGAFNVLDVMLSAQQFMAPRLSGTTPVLNVFWQPGSWIDGSYYCNEQQPATPGFQCELGPGIYILNETASLFDDTDEFDDDVLWHEYGHFISYHYSRDESGGGCHTFDDSFQQLPLSWSEGWGDFFQGAVKSSMTMLERSSQDTSPGMYVDTALAGNPIWLDFSNPPATDNYRYASNETAVAKILLDMEQQFGFASIWQIVTSLEWNNTTNRRVNLELFWDIAVRRLDSGGGVAQLNEASLLAIFNARGVNYALDNFEPNSNAASATSLTSGVSQSHTLYSAAVDTPDEDWFVISASAGTPFTVRTRNLRNGADTEMWLYADDGVGGLTQLARDNDYLVAGMYYSNSSCGNMAGNTLDGFASQITYTPQQSGNYYVKISTSQIPEYYTGQYGSYEIVLNP